jgi:hypothetical protein
MQFNNDRQRLILMGVLQDQRRLAATHWGDGHSMSRDALGRHRLRIHQAREGLVPMALENWIGHMPSNSEHVLYHREYLRLEDMGMLVRCNLSGGRRTTHLKLTPAGTRAAERLLAEEEAGGLAETIDWSGLEIMLVDMPSESENAGKEPQ